MSETKPTPESLEAAESCVYRWYGKHPTLILHSSIREDLQARVAHEIDSRVSQAVREEREQRRELEEALRIIASWDVAWPERDPSYGTMALMTARMASPSPLRAHPTSEPSSGETERPGLDSAAGGATLPADVEATGSPARDGGVIQ